MTSGKFIARDRHRKEKPNSVKKNRKSRRSSLSTNVGMEMSDKQYKKMLHKNVPLRHQKEWSGV